MEWESESDTDTAETPPEGDETEAWGQVGTPHPGKTHGAKGHQDPGQVQES